MSKMTGTDKHRIVYNYCTEIERVIKSCENREELYQVHTSFNSLCSRGTSCLKEKADELIDSADESSQLRKENESLKQQLEEMKKEMEKMKQMKEMMRSFINT